MARTAILLGIGELAVLDEAGGIAGHDGPGGDIAGDDGTGADDTPLVDGHAGEHRGAGRDPAGKEEHPCIFQVSRLRRSHSSDCARFSASRACTRE